MTDIVIKKDGSKQKFEKEKIKNSILNAAEDAGLEINELGGVIDKVLNSVLEIANSVEEISTTQIREKILEALDEIEESISDSWRDYEEEYK